MVKKTIGIMTFTTSLRNYGQILQAYALQSYLRDKGHNAVIINYDMRARLELNREARLARLKYFIKNIPPVRRRLMRGHMELPDLCHFRRFKEQHMTFSPITYHTLRDLQRRPFEADVYMTGSDQVWGVHIPNIEPYLLNFGRPDTPRVAYAASFGRVKFSRHELRYIPPLLRRYKAVGVRETSGIEACQTLRYPDAVLTPDPTILRTREQWDSLSGGRNPFRTDKTRVFVYSCYLPKGTLPAIATSLSGDKEIITADIVNDDPAYSHLSIEEWIGAVKNADYVVTNSFHCTMFSLYFNKPFVVFKYRPGYCGSMNTRLDSILSQLRLTDRFIAFDDQDKTEQVLRTPIDWSEVNERLEDMRRIGADFLETNV